MKRSAAGFTLLEVLLVVVVMSLTAMMVVQTLPPSQNDVLQTQASRFYQRLQLLNDDAMLNGQDFGIYIEPNQFRYNYLLLTSEGWQPVEESKFFTETEMPQDIQFSYQLGSDIWQDEERLFKPGSLFDDDRFADLEEKKVKPPQLFVLSSGEITPFVIKFFASQNTQRAESEPLQTWRVAVRDNGEIHLLAPGEPIPGMGEDDGR